jgi:hypothetical protein
MQIRCTDVNISVRIEVVEQAVGLPPMTYENILLRLEPYQVQTYNVIVAALITNAVDSERCDEVSSMASRDDYLLTTMRGLYVPPEGGLLLRDVKSD